MFYWDERKKEVLHVLCSTPFLNPCPLGGRVGLAFGEPLRRCGRGVFSGRWDQVPQGPVRKGRRRRVLRRLTHHQPCGWSPALAKGGYTLGPSAHCLFQYKGEAHVLVIRPLQGRGTVAPAQWWWVSSPLGCVSIQEHLPPAKGLLWREAVRPHRPCSSLFTLHSSLFFSFVVPPTVFSRIPGYTGTIKRPGHRIPVPGPM